MDLGAGRTESGHCLLQPPWLAACPKGVIWRQLLGTSVMLWFHNLFPQGHDAQQHGVHQAASQHCGAPPVQGLSPGNISLFKSHSSSSSSALPSALGTRGSSSWSGQQLIPGTSFPREEQIAAALTLSSDLSRVCRHSVVLRRSHIGQEV